MEIILKFLHDNYRFNIIENREGVTKYSNDKFSFTHIYGEFEYEHFIYKGETVLDFNEILFDITAKGYNFKYDIYEVKIVNYYMKDLSKHFSFFIRNEDFYYHLVDLPGHYEKVPIELVLDNLSEEYPIIRGVIEDVNRN